MKKLLLSSALALSVISGSAMADIHNGQLTFSWQAAIPSAPILDSKWAFVDALDIAWEPAGAEELKVTKGTGNITLASLKPFDFFIAPVTGKADPGNKITRPTPAISITGVDVFLASNPVTTGLVDGKQLGVSANAVAGDNEVAITLNGEPLQVGSGNQKAVSVTSGKDPHIVIEANAKIANGQYVDGGSISISAPVVFAVNI
ncbi:TPA: Cro/Cl family transcriptional regulator [Salmonella enterica subsp. enterica serovar Reading]